MTQQKLYTEEEVRKAIDFFITDEIKKDKIIKTLSPIELSNNEEIEKEIRDILELFSHHYGYSIEEAAKDICGLLTPIELPNDEEIEKQSIGNATFAPSFVYGAKWMRDKILNK